MGIEPGTLVKFAPVDYGIDIELPIGYKTKLDAIYQWKNSQNREKFFIPHTDSIGVIIKSDETLKEARTIRLAQVMVDGVPYWFESQFVMPLQMTEEVE